METSRVSDNPPDEVCRSEKDAVDAVTLGQRIDRICEAAQTTWKSGHDLVRECRGALDIDGRVERNPYAMMATAMGSGYVLGGGIFSPLAAQIVSVGLRLGLRFAAIRFIQRELLACAESVTEGGKGSLSTSHQT